MNLLTKNNHNKKNNIAYRGLSENMCYVTSFLCGSNECILQVL